MLRTVVGETRHGSTAISEALDATSVQQPRCLARIVRESFVLVLLAGLFQRIDAIFRQVKGSELHAMDYESDFGLFYCSFRCFWEKCAKY